MWNVLTSSYIFLASIAFVLIGAGTVLGIRLALLFPSGVITINDRSRWDRIHTLLVTLMSVGIVVRIFLAPLWFFALSSLVASIPGGMCLASVHNLGEPFSWAASALKGIVPAFLLIWLAMDRLDRHFDDEPFLQKKLVWLPALLVLVLAETFVDIGFFVNLDLGPSPCCMSLFDGPGVATNAEGMPTWIGALVLAGVSALLLGWGLVRGPGKISALLSILLTVSWIWALHGRLGAVWMNTPSHHCLFCVWRLEWSSVLASILVIFGAWLTLGRSVLAMMLHPSPRAPISLRFPLVFVAVGLVISLLAVVF